MVRLRPRGLLLPIAVLVVVAAGALAHESAPAPAPSAIGSALLGPSVKPNDHHDTSPRLTDLPPATVSSGRQENDQGQLPRPLTIAGATGPVIQAAPAALQMPVTTTNFSGVGNGFTGPAGTFTVNAAPPDTNGDVGPNNYVQVVNTDFAVWNKAGTVVFGPVPLNTLWSGFGGGCQANNDGDPTVKYDRMADRWIITQFSVSSTPYLECVAVSTTPDPTGSYYRYSFSYGTVNFPDYPKLGVWPDAYYVTFNNFANARNFAGAEVCAYDRTSMLGGAAATQQCFTTSTTYGGLLPADFDGSRLPPAGSPNYLVALGATTTQLATWQFHVDWRTPANSTFTGPTTLATAAYSEACGGGTCIPQAGTTQQLDSLSDRLMYRLAYRNFGDHEALVVNHSVTAGSSTGIRWYELRPDGGHNLSLFQQGTYAPDTNFRWMGSIAQDQSGDMALGFSLSGTTISPQIHYTGRLAADALGAMTQGEGAIINGAGSQTGSGLSRWGDYSSMAIDPVDDCTFWYTTEYIPANGAFNWSTRIASFKFPSCAPAANDFSIAASPATLSLAPGASGATTVSTAVTSGVAETVTLSASGLPAGVSASFSPASVAAGGSSTLTLTASASAAASTSTVTVTGTATSAAHSASLALTVSAPAAVPGAPTLTAARNNRPGVQLSWTVPASNGSPITAYRIYRSTVSGAEVYLVQVGSASTAYRDTATVSGRRYYYRILAVNGVGQGPLSNEASARAR